MYIFFNGTITLIMILIFLFIYPKFNYLMKILGIITFLFFFLCYTLVFLINPGYPKHDLESKTGEPRDKYRWCGACKIWVSIEKKTNHCFDCGICIEGYDHHCPWTSKCIGRRNLYSFYIFVTTTFLMIFYFIFAISYSNK